MQYADPFTLWMVNYSMISSLIPFLACLKLRKMTLAKLEIKEVCENSLKANYDVIFLEFNE